MLPLAHSTTTNLFLGGRKAYFLPKRRNRSRRWRSVTAAVISCVLMLSLLSRWLPDRQEHVDTTTLPRRIIPNVFTDREWMQKHLPLPRGTSSPADQNDRSTSMLLVLPNASHLETFAPTACSMSRHVSMLSIVVRSPFNESTIRQCDLPIVTLPSNPSQFDFALSIILRKTNPAIIIRCFDSENDLRSLR